MRASVTGPRSSGSGTVTPVLSRIWLALRRITSSTAPSIALSGENIMIDRTSLGRLAEAIDAALALLMPRRIPGQIVVDDRVEELLEVDAFRKAVGGDEDALGLFAVLVLAPCRQRDRGVRRA